MMKKVLSHVYTPEGFDDLYCLIELQPGGEGTLRALAAEVEAFGEGKPAFVGAEFNIWDDTLPLEVTWLRAAALAEDEEAAREFAEAIDDADEVLRRDDFSPVLGPEDEWGRHANVCGYVEADTLFLTTTGGAEISAATENTGEEVRTISFALSTLLDE
jgi:hypothetical protein